MHPYFNLLIKKFVYGSLRDFSKLVLQLHIRTDFSMCNGSVSLVLAPPS